MVLCQECPKRHECKSICKAVKKEITGRGKTASLKPKTYPVDFSYIENTHQNLNSFQIGVLNTVKDITSGVKGKLLEKLAVQEAMDKTLSGKERQVIELFVQRYRQEEIAKKMGISQPRANFLLKRALRKLKYFFLKGL